MINFNSNIIRGIKNSSYLAIGNIASLFVSTIGFIFIARLLGPTDYGIYTTVGVFVSTFDILLLGGLHRVLLRESSKNIPYMWKYLEKTIGIRSLLIILAIIVCIFCSFFTTYAFQTKIFIVLFSATLAYNGFNGFFNIIYQANEKMQYISILSVFNRIIFATLAIAFLYLGFGLLVLFLILLFSQFLTLILNIKFSKKFVEFNLFSRIHFDKKLLKPTLIFSLLFFVGFLTTRVDILMISFLGTATDVGIYGVAYNIVNQGVMFRNIMAEGFFPVLTKHFHKKKMQGKFLVKYSMVFFIGIMTLSLIASFYVEKIVILFGEGYTESGNILKVLIFYLGFWYATMPFTTAAQTTGNEKMVLYGRSIMAILNIPLNYLFFTMFGLTGIAYSTLMIYSIGGIIIILLIYSAMKRQGHIT